MSFLVVETSRACSAAIDFGKLFSSSFDFLSFHTARVANGPDALEMRCPLLSRKQTSIGRRRKVGFLDLIPKSLRTNQAHRSSADKLQRFDHPPHWGLSGQWS